MTSASPRSRSKVKRAATSSRPRKIDFAYNALGQFTSIVDYNTLSGPRTDVATGAYSYDTANRLTGLAYTSNGGANTIDTFGWGYDAANSVTSFTSVDGTASYGYDPTNQLTSATYTTASGGHQPSNESYSCDLNGNRNSTGYSTGSDNLMSSDGTFNYQHDADGNQTVRTRISTNYASDYKTTYSWDYRNRLTDVEYFDNNNVLTKHVHFVYDVFDHLLATEVDSTGSGSYNQVERYALDGSQPALEFDGNGNLVTRNLIGPSPAGVDAVLAQEAVSSLSQGGAVTWMIDDNLGSVRVVLDNNSNVLDKIDYNSFGVVAYESAPSTNHWAGFAGGHVDPTTGLVDNGARWLDPATGRWLSQDPLDFAAGDANLSRYVTNSPTNAIDPTGLSQYTVSAVISHSVWNSTNGGEAHFWSVATSTGITVSSSDYTPGLLVSTGAPWDLLGYNQFGVVYQVPNKPPADPTSTVYTGMLAADPDLAAKIEQAKEDMKKLAMTSVMFTATGPMVKPMNWKPIAGIAAVGTGVEHQGERPVLPQPTVRRATRPITGTIKMQQQIEQEQEALADLSEKLRALDRPGKADKSAL